MAPPIRRIQAGNAAARGAAARPTPAPPPKKATAKRTEEIGRGFVASKVSDRDGPYHEGDKEVEVLRRTFEENEHPAYVKVGAGLTINQGNFESLRIDCSVTIPCLPNEIEDAYVIASDFVADRIAEEQAAWLGQGNGKKKG